MSPEEFIATLYRNDDSDKDLDQIFDYMDDTLWECGPLGPQHPASDFTSLFNTLNQIEPKRISNLTKMLSLLMLTLPVKNHVERRAFAIKIINEVCRRDPDRAEVLLRGLL